MLSIRSILPAVLLLLNAAIPAAAVDCTDWAGEVPVAAELRTDALVAPFAFSGLLVADGDVYRYDWSLHDLEAADATAAVYAGADTATGYFEHGGAILGARDHRVVWRVFSEGDLAIDGVFYGDFRSAPGVVEALPGDAVGACFTGDVLVLARAGVVEFRDAAASGVPVLGQLPLALEQLHPLDDGYLVGMRNEINPIAGYLYYIDLGDPSEPVWRDLYSLSSSLGLVACHEERLYVRVANSRLTALDRSDPDHLSVVWNHDAAYWPHGAIRGDIGVVYADGSAQVLDLAPATGPVVLSTIATGARYVLASEALYARRASGGIIDAWDLSEPTAPTFIGTAQNVADTMLLVEGGLATHGLLYLDLLPRHCLPTGVTPPAAPAAGLRAVPNPFNPRTTLHFTLPTAGSARLRLYDGRGALVRTLVDGKLTAGDHAVSWDGRDDHGRARASGVYLVRLESREAAAATKLVLLR